MRILIINHSDTQGGSARTAYRLSKGLKRYHGIECHFLVGVKMTADANVFCTRKSQNEYYIEFALDRLTNALGLQYQCFPFSTRTILKKAEELKPDLIYLRNTHGGYFKTSLISKLSLIAPVAWTLSDMWSFTGNCAHAFGDESWKEMRGCRNNSVYPAIGINTGRWLLRQKRRIYRKSNFSVISPSRWLYNLARQSPVFEDKEIVQIYNGFDLEVFRQKDKASCRAAMNIPPDSRVLMFGADSLADNPWKGGKELLSILRAINSKVSHNVHLLVVGSGDLKGLEHFENLVVHKVGRIQSDTFMAACYSAADVFIYPTRADNLPNTLIEAISCCTPCITFDVGGCGEIIKDGVGGYVIAPFEIDAFADRTVRLIDDGAGLKKLSLSARRFAEENFTLEKMSANYYNYFKEIIGKK
jgi:glycosyltransferase involved in cell wall biosynthesis